MDPSHQPVSGSVERLRAYLDSLQQELRDAPFAFLDMLPTYVWAAAPTGETVYFNRAALGFWGLQPDELVGYRWAQTLHPEDRQAAFEAINQAARRRGEFLAESRLRRHDGEYRWITSVGKPWYDSSGSFLGYMGVGLDVTDQRLALVEANRHLVREVEQRRQAEAGLLDSEDTLRALVNANLDSCVLVDPAGRVLAANEAFARRVAGDRGSVVGADILDLFPAELVETRRAHLEWVVAHGRPLRFEDEDRSRHLLTSVYPVLGPGGAVTGLAVYGVDITERTRAEKELRASERRFRQLAENAQDLIFRLRVRPSVGVEYVSPSAYVLTGYPVQAFYDDPLFYRGILVPEDRPKLLGLLSSDWDGSVKRVLLRWRHRDGRIVWTEQVYAGVYDAAGHLEAVEGIARDVTDRQEHEERLRYLATHDALTGAGNRAFYEEALGRLRRGGEFPVTVAIADLDGLKAANDRYGHGAGDDLIVRAARMLQDCVRLDDVVARIGGDEFALLLPRSGDAGAADLRQRVAAALDPEGSVGTPVLRLSLGTAVASGPDDLSDAVERADRAMYAAKQAARAAAWAGADRRAPRPGA